MHEYKRQLLNLLHVITLYNRIKRGTQARDATNNVYSEARLLQATVMAKLIIKLINSVAERINNDPAANKILKVVFLPRLQRQKCAVDLSGGGSVRADFHGPDTRPRARVT